MGNDLKNKQITFITEGGKKSGFGHITRCLSIETIFKQYSYKSNFIIAGDSSISQVIPNTSYIVLNWIEKPTQLLKQLSQSSLVLIDSIQISNQQILAIQNLNIPVIFIDDEKRRNILEYGFVIDWTVLSDKKNYFLPKKNNIHYLLGSLYTPLRKDFSSATVNNIKENINNILVTLGGSDIRNLTPVILKAITTHFPKIQKNIVIGAGFTNIKEIEQYADHNTHFISNANSQKMVELMQNNDLTIACGGQTLYELARIGTPTIAILVVENAKDDTLGWEKVGSVKYIGWWDNTNLINNLITAINNLQDKKTRQSMQNKAQQYISPNGAEILVKEIIDNLP